MTISVYRGVGVVRRGTHPTLGTHSWAKNCDKEPVSNNFFFHLLSEIFCNLNYTIWQSLSIATCNSIETQYRFLRLLPVVLRQKRRVLSGYFLHYGTSDDTIWWSASSGIEKTVGNGSSANGLCNFRYRYVRVHGFLGTELAPSFPRTRNPA
jgi:hypothetical protein